MENYWKIFWTEHAGSTTSGHPQRQVLRTLHKKPISEAQFQRILKDIEEKVEIYEMIRADIRDTIGQYLSGLMDAELTHFLCRKPYERLKGDVNHRNGFYDRNFTLKGIGEVDLQVPRERKGDFKTHVIPRGKRYEDALRQDLCLMFW